MGGEDEGTWVNIDGSVSKTGSAKDFMYLLSLVQNGGGFRNDEGRVERAAKSGRR
jgi:hypothetical protein